MNSINAENLLLFYTSSSSRILELRNQNSKTYTNGARKHIVANISELV